MQKKYSIINNITNIFIVFLLISTTVLITFSILNTKNNMYEQMLTQGKQLGNQINSNLESDESIQNANEIRSENVSENVKKTLLQLGKDTKIIYVGVLNIDGIVISHSELSRIGKQYPGSVNSNMVRGQIIDSIYFDKEKNVNALNLGIPIKNKNGKVIGGLFLGLSIETVDNAIKNIIKISIITGFIIFLLTIISLRFIIGKLIKPVVYLAEASEKYAEGDFTHQVETKSKNEIGLLTKSFGKMIDELKSVILRISEMSNEITSTAGDLETVSQDSVALSKEIKNKIETVEEGANTQESQSLKVKNNMDMMNEIRAILNEEVSSLNKLMKELIEVSKVSNIEMEKMNSQMEAIEDSSIKSSLTIKSLIDSSNEMGNIVDVINSIARQTNMLAINASIEASNAGESGKGFMIVAIQIRELAEKSLTSAKEISSLIEDTQNKSNRTIESIEEASEESKKGKNRVMTVKEKFSMILESLEMTESKFFTLESKFQELNLNSQKVSESVNEIKEISEMAVKNTKEVSKLIEKQHETTYKTFKSAELLLKLSSQIKNMVNKFKL